MGVVRAIITMGGRLAAELKLPPPSRARPSALAPRLSQCQCFEGWAGADCSRRVGGGSGHGVPAWAITLIVLSSVALAGVFLIAASRIIELVQVRAGVK